MKREREGDALEYIEALHPARSKITFLKRNWQVRSSNGWRRTSCTILLFNFMEHYDFLVLTVYDELIVPEEEHAVAKEFMFTSGYCEVCSRYSLSDQIKQIRYFSL